jgi:protein gp37
MQPIPNINEVMADYPEFTGIHPVATVFPMKPDDEFWELVKHIEQNGVVEKILRERGTGLLVDGRNRLLAVSITRSLFEVEDIDPDSVLCRVTATNQHGKKFDKSAAGVIAAELRPFYDEEARRRRLATQNNKAGAEVELVPHQDASKSRDAAGKALGVNGRYVDMGTDILMVDKDLAEEVKAGKVHIKEAHKTIKAQATAIKEARKEVPKTPKKSAATLSPGMAPIETHDGRVTFINRPNWPTFNQTNDSVSWARWTWNPVTGCEHGCKFCYARAIATSDRMSAVYPFGFAPAFHEYRLEAPANTSHKVTDDERDGRVFVCSMADLFGKWVPEKWIKAVFAACAKSSQWEYLFLTKWPKRYSMLATLPKAWFGASIIKQADVDRVTRDMTSFDAHAGIIRWVSLEPMLEPITFNDISWCDLMVIGAQTGTHQPDGFVPAFQPKFEWVADVVAQCRAAGIPYYLKPNLASEPGMELTQMEPRRRQ